MNPRKPVVLTRYETAEPGAADVCVLHLRTGRALEISDEGVVVFGSLSDYGARKVDSVLVFGRESASGRRLGLLALTQGWRAEAAQVRARYRGMGDLERQGAAMAMAFETCADGVEALLTAESRSRGEDNPT
jgi:hypothetical protein